MSCTWTGILDGLPAEVVGGAVGEALLEAAAGQPHGKAVRIVVAAVVGLATHESAAHLDHRRAAEFRARHDDGLVEQAARLQVLDERGKGLVGVAAGLAMQFDVEVVIPWVALGVVDLHHAHAVLDEARRGQAAARRAAFAVHLQSLGDSLRTSNTSGASVCMR